MAQKTYRDAIREALREEMLRDENVFILGEEVGVWGGTYAVTRGLLDRRPGTEAADRLGLTGNADVGADRRFAISAPRAVDAVVAAARGALYRVHIFDVECGPVGHDSVPAAP